MMETDRYLFELESLSRAVNYQKWIVDSIRPFLGSRILEVGAGIGNMSRWLPVREKLLITESENLFLPMLEKALDSKNKEKIEVRALDLSKDWVKEFSTENLDTIISFNVLEHIEDDAEVISKFRKILLSSSSPGPKRIVTVVPAHQWAYGEVDRIAGHYRRYSRKQFERLKQQSAPDFKLHTAYFNVFGLPGWWLMGRVLKKRNIGSAAVKSFEKLCPKIKGIDNFLHRKLKLPFGQSIIGVLSSS